MEPLSDIEISEVRSLIKLVDDDAVSLTARTHLISKGDKILPLLEESLPNQKDPAWSILSEIYNQIVSSTIKESFREYRKKNLQEYPLEEGVFLIARYGYPTTNFNNYLNIINNYASDLMTRLNPNSDPEEIASDINHYFFQEIGYKGNKDDYYNPDNNYINRVIDTKKGLPISLSVIYLLVCQKLNIPVKGIGLPGHFLVRFDFPEKIFFVDPFAGGTFMTAEDCKILFNLDQFSLADQYLEPVENKLILERMMRNLIAVYEKREEKKRVDSLLQYIDIINSSV